jgi:hypothetical protein
LLFVVGSAGCLPAPDKGGDTAASDTAHATGDDSGLADSGSRDSGGADTGPVDSGASDTGGCGGIVLDSNKVGVSECTAQIGATGCATGVSTTCTADESLCTITMSGPSDFDGSASYEIKWTYAGMTSCTGICTLHTDQGAYDIDVTSRAGSLGCAAR